MSNSGKAGKLQNQEQFKTSKLSKIISAPVVTTLWNIHITNSTAKQS
jgi:hypothetical protein